MKRHLMIALMAVAAVALVAAPGWAAGGRVLSDRQLDSIHAGSSDPVHDVSTSSGKARAASDGEPFVAGAASSAAAAVASDVGSALAVKINNKCNSGSGDCELKIFESVDNDGQDNTGANAQSILNTVGSVSAVQINVSSSGASQLNVAYSAEGAIGEIDSADDAAASADSLAVDVNGHFASADSSASSAASSASTLAFATPRVEVKNRCGASGECKLKIFDNLRNNGDTNTGANAQSIVNTVASVNAVQINVAGTASTSQTNIAYSTFGASLP